MAIAFGAINTAGNTTGSYTSIAISGGATIGLVYAIGDTAADNLTGVTWGGVAMTKIGTSFRASGNRYHSIWYVVNPTSASTIVLTGGTYKEAHEFYYTGVHQSSPIDSSNNGTAGAGSAFITLSTTVVASNCWTVMGSTDSANQLHTSDVTERMDSAGSNYELSDSNATVATGSQSITHTLAAGTSDHAGLIFSIAPAASFTILDTNTLTETTTAVFGRSFTLLETTTLSEVTSVIRSTFFTILDTITKTDTWVSPITTLWTRVAKNVATLINQTKH